MGQTNEFAASLMIDRQAASQGCLSVALAIIL